MITLYNLIAALIFSVISGFVARDILGEHNKPTILMITRVVLPFLLLIIFVAVTYN